MGAVIRVWRLGDSPMRFGESFTAVAGRMPLGSMLSFLRDHDSHPPLDYLLRAPLSRTGASTLVLRTPSVLLSIAALGLFAWWNRDRRRVGVIATSVMALSTFQIAHGRDARMYADMELIGVAAAVLAGSWRRQPKRYHAPAIGALVLVALLTHISAFLLLVGLLVLPGRRSDREAWRWRAWLVAAFAGWAVTWGPSFLVQAKGGHSSWIPHTTFEGFVSVTGSLIAVAPPLNRIAFVVTVAGAIVLLRRKPEVARVWTCCFAVPLVLGAVLGRFAPLLIDRTFTVVAWGASLAIGFAVDALLTRGREVGGAAVLLGGAVMCVSAYQNAAYVAPVDATTRHLEAVARPEDIIVLTPPGKAIELEWSLGVRSDDGPVRFISLPELPSARALEIGYGRTVRRVWLLRGVDSHTRTIAGPACAPPWSGANYVVDCVRIDGDAANNQLAIVARPGRGRATAARVAANG